MFKKNLLISAVLLSSAGAAMAAPSQEITLQGIITNTTCDVTVNGGKSVFNVGVFKTSEFLTANTQVGDKPLNVTLSDCTVDEVGNLVVLGVTSTENNDKNLFVNNYSDKVGFMIKDSADAQVTTDSLIPLSVTTGTPANYAFKVGMGSADTSPTAKAYSAPIVIAYIVQ